MGFLVDSSIWVAVERGRISAADIHAITHQEPVYVSPVNLAEIRFGIDLMSNSSKRLKALSMLKRMERKPLLKISGATGQVFGSLAAQLRKSGRGADFRIQDLWLAAQALEHSFFLMTSNAKDFEDIPKLKLVKARFA